MWNTSKTSSRVVWDYIFSLFVYLSMSNLLLCALVLSIRVAGSCFSWGFFLICQRLRKCRQPGRPSKVNSKSPTQVTGALVTISLKGWADWHGQTRQQVWRRAGRPGPMVRWPLLPGDYLQGVYEILYIQMIIISKYKTQINGDHVVFWVYYMKRIGCLGQQSFTKLVVIIQKYMTYQNHLLYWVKECITWVLEVKIKFNVYIGKYILNKNDKHRLTVSYMVVNQWYMLILTPA